MTPPFLHSLSSTTAHSSKANPTTFEPDGEWKRQLKSRIHRAFQSRVQDAKDDLLAKLRSVEILESLERLDLEYKATLASIKQLANGQYQAELKKERNKRRQIAGEPMTLGSNLHIPSLQLPASVPPPTRNHMRYEMRASNVPEAPKIENMLIASSINGRASYEFVEPSELYFGEDDAQIGTEIQSHRLKKKEKAIQEKDEKLSKNNNKTKTLQQEPQKITDKTQEGLYQFEEACSLEHKIRERKRALKVHEEELKRHGAETRMKEEAQRFQAQIAEKTHRIEQENTKREEAREARKAEQACIQEAALKQIYEEETRRVQQELRRKGVERIADEARRARAEADRLIFDIGSPFLAADDLIDDVSLNPKPVKEQAVVAQQHQYPQQADTIKQKRQEQRSRLNNFGTDTLWPYPSLLPLPISSNRQALIPQTPHFSSTSPLEKTSSATSSVRNEAGLAWSSSTTSTSSATSVTSATSATSVTSATSAASSWTQHPKPAMNVPLQGQPRTVPVTSGTYLAGSSPFYTPRTEEWQRRQTEFTNARQGKFRREQEKMEADIQMRSVDKPHLHLDLQRVFETHERLWTQLSQKSDLTWHDFPWPIIQNGKVPASPGDISYSLVAAYMHSTSWPDVEKSKDRIKENMRRWHPDRFKTNFLPRVVESEREHVKQGAEFMARSLRDLFRKENVISGGGKISRDDNSSVPAHGLRATNEEELKGLNTQGRRKALSGSSNTIVSGRPVDIITANANHGAQQPQQPIKKSLVVAKEHMFVKPTDGRLGDRHAAKNQPVRMHRAEANDAAALHSAPIPATSAAVSMKGGMVKKAVKRKKVTFEVVSDEEIDHRGERLPLDSQFILEPAY